MGTEDGNLDRSSVQKEEVIVRGQIGIVGVQMDLGSIRKGVDMGPLAIRHAGLISRLRESGYEVLDIGDIVPLVEGDEGNPKMRFAETINEANFRLYQVINTFYQKHKFPIILGGDHSIAAGSVAASADYYKKISIIWIDAHADFNDEKITPSGNMHGMPLSAVCGLGPESMVSFSKYRVDPKNVVILGARSIDPLERIKLKKNGVSIFSISDIHTMGIRNVMERALQIAAVNTVGIHVSFDMDALDPREAPGVGTPVLNGLSQREAFTACEMIYKAGKMIAIDLVETNPLLDKRNMTGKLASELIMSCLGSTDY